MDHQYGIAVSNKFSLFGSDEEDPIEYLRQQEEKKQKDEGTKAKTKKSKKAPQVVSAESKGKPAEIVPQKKEGGSAPPTEKLPPRQGNERLRGGRPNREPREIRENEGERRPPRRVGPKEPREPKGDENVPPEYRERPEGSSFRIEERERGRGRGRGPRGERGRGRGRGFAFPPGERGGRREFDRHSGSDRTGIKPVDKKEGGGGHNWGTLKDDMEDLPREPTTDEEQPRETPENPEPTETGEGEGVAEEEKGPKEMTLDEWKALQQQSRAKQGFNLRKPGEGVDTSQWKKGIVYQKKPTVEGESDNEEDEDELEDDEDKHHGKNLVNIPITFNDSARRGRGGRRPRGGRVPGGRGAGRGGGGPAEKGKARESAPRMDDENFPSLVKTEA